MNMNPGSRVLPTHLTVTFRLSLTDVTDVFVIQMLTFQKPPTNCCEWLRTFFDTRYVKETLMVAFKQGPNNRRLRVIMLVIVMCVIIGPIYGEYILWFDIHLSQYSAHVVVNISLPLCKEHLWLIDVILHLWEIVLCPFEDRLLNLTALLLFAVIRKKQIIKSQNLHDPFNQ